MVSMRRRPKCRRMPGCSFFILAYGKTLGAVDELKVTGESIPVEKHADDEVIGATINMTGTFQIEAVRVVKDTIMNHERR